MTNYIKLPLTLIFVCCLTTLVTSCDMIKTMVNSGQRDTTFVKAAHSADESVTINEIQGLYRAQQMYKNANGSYGTLDQLVDKGMINRVPGGARTYRYNVTASEEKFQCTSVPQVYGTSGRFSFYLDETGVLRGADHQGAEANASDPPVSLNR